MHIGNLRTALYTYIIARKNKGKFILRIEDTDQGRYVEGATDVIYRTLKTCGLNWDEGPDVGGPCGPYIQSQRMGMFKEYAEKLRAANAELSAAVDQADKGDALILRQTDAVAVAVKALDRYDAVFGGDGRQHTL